MAPRSSELTIVELGWFGVAPVAWLLLRFAGAVRNRGALDPDGGDEYRETMGQWMRFSRRNGGLA